MDATMDELSEQLSAVYEAQADDELPLLATEDLNHVLNWISDQIPGGFFVYYADDQQKLIFANDMMLTLYGCETREEFSRLTGDTFYGIVHPDDYAETQAAIDEQIAKMENNNLDYVEYRIIRKDGSVRWVDDYGKLVNLPGYGEVYFVFIIDVTERHQGRDSQKRQVSYYCDMLEQLDMPSNSQLTCRINLTTDIIGAIGGVDFCETDYVGGSYSMFLKVHADRFPHGEDRERFLSLFNKDNLLQLFKKGVDPAPFTGYRRKHSGEGCFVCFTGKLAANPADGNVMLFLRENLFDEEYMVSAIYHNMLTHYYQCAGYVVDGQVHIVYGDRNEVYPYESFVEEYGHGSGQLDWMTVEAALQSYGRYSIEVSNRRIYFCSVNDTKDISLVMVTEK